jgi:hypothetical protein
VPLSLSLKALANHLFKVDAGRGILKFKREAPLISMSKLSTQTRPSELKLVSVFSLNNHREDVLIHAYSDYISRR